MSEDSMIAWLTKTLAEVRARAEAAEADAASPWTVEQNVWTKEWDTVVASSPLPGYTLPVYELWSGEGSDGVYGSEKVAEFVASMDPATALLSVSATEKLLELHPEHDVTKFGDASKSSICDNCKRPWPCTTVKIEAERWGWTDDG